jgi:hypothetical protein
MGARAPYDVQSLEHTREEGLLDLLAAALSGWPHESEIKPLDLAATLGVKLERSIDGDHARIDPDTLPRWYRDVYAHDPGSGWEEL